jgi:hypothetical protein
LNTLWGLFWLHCSGRKDKFFPQTVNVFFRHRSKITTNSINASHWQSSITSYSQQFWSLLNNCHPINLTNGYICALATAFGPKSLAPILRSWVKTPAL